jgi:CTD small phosphatase-like protein 2
VFVEGNYLKDLSVLGRDLAHTVIVDNSPQVHTLSSTIPLFL